VPIESPDGFSVRAGPATLHHGNSELQLPQINAFLIMSTHYWPMSRIDLERIRDWATAKLSGVREAQHAVHQYMKLRETAESILANMETAKSEIPSSSTSTPAREARLRLVWSNNQRA
jgi:hypothetical protein